MKNRRRRRSTRWRKGMSLEKSIRSFRLHQWFNLFQNRFCWILTSKNDKSIWIITLVMHAWNFPQTFAQTWIGEQSFRCIDPTCVRRTFSSSFLSRNRRFLATKLSKCLFLLAPVYAWRQIIAAVEQHQHLNKYACQLTYLKTKGQISIQFLCFLMTNDLHLSRSIDSLPARTRLSEGKRSDVHLHIF